MKKRISFLLAGASLLLVVSCKKSQDTNPAQSQLIGTWKFISMKAHTQSVAQESANGSVYKSITISDYTTINNAGTVVFTADMMNTSGFTYEVSTTLYATSYVDGQFLDSVSTPFDYVLPVTSSSTKYKLIGTDSLYFPAGGVVSSSALPGGGTQQAAAIGSKFILHGDTLSVTTIVHQVNTQTASGVTVTSTGDGLEIVTLKKQ